MHIMVRVICITALISSALTWLLAASHPTGLPAKIRLDNAWVRVTELSNGPGVPRERHIRPANQVIVFLDDCRYERTDSQTGERTVRARSSGDVIWHDRGEDAPRLVNLGTKPYRTLVIDLK